MLQVSDNYSNPLVENVKIILYFEDAKPQLPYVLHRAAHYAVCAPQSDRVVCRTRFESGFARAALAFDPHLRKK